MSEKEKEIIVKWLIENVDSLIIPRYGGGRRELFYNLIHFVRDGKDHRKYAYEPDQDDELVSLGILKARILSEAEKEKLAKEILEKYPDAVHILKQKPVDIVLNVQNVKTVLKTTVKEDK